MTVTGDCCAPSLAVPIRFSSSDVARRLRAYAVRIRSADATQKTYILETTGNGAAIFDFDGDGANDILIANGTTLDGSKNGRATVTALPQ